MHKIIDVSMRMREGMLSYPGDPKFMLSSEKTIQEDGLNLSRAEFGMHTGTHVDAPAHFIRDGATIDLVALEVLCGPARVLDCTQVKEKITRKDIEGGFERGERILLKTNNSRFLGDSNFREDFIYLEADAAFYLAEAGVKLVGVDYLSAEKYGSNKSDVHNILLGAEIPIIEGLDLEKVKGGIYMMYCLPLPVDGSEAAPARCVLLETTKEDEEFK